MNMSWNEKVDVLVVGTGFAGLAAAIEAKERGLDVLIVEKMKGPGGNSIISDGGIAAPMTHLQDKYGIEDSPQRMFNDMYRAGLGLNHKALLHTLVEHAKEAFDWTVDVLKVPYMDRVDLFGGHSVPRCYTPVGKTGGVIIKKMLERVRALNIPIVYGVFFKSVLMGSENQVIGANVLKNYNFISGEGLEHTIMTRSGVILATGGFGADVAFRQIQDPRLDDSIQTTNKPFATAEGLKSALAIGAASVQLSQIQLGAWASPDEKGFGDGPLFADYVLFQYGIIIDPKSGQRFVNELGDRKVIADAMLEIGHPCIGIADSEAVDTAGWDLSKAISKGVIRLFDDLDTLAESYGINSVELKKTVQTYNGFVEQNLDEAFKKPIVDQASPIVKAPFYAMRLWPKVHYTMGGLRINQDAQVLDFEGNAIKGLYAAGEVVGGVHGASRLGSCAITECIVYGRLAGKNI